MGKKDFIALADLVRAEGRDVFSARAIEALAGFCKRQNPNFNRKRWLAYVYGLGGPNGGAVKPSKG